MEIMHLRARSKVSCEIPDNLLKEIPAGLGVVTTIQHLWQIDKVVTQVKGVLCGQVLGCRTERADKSKVSGFLFVGSGKFHPLAVAMNTGKTVYCYDPMTKKLTKIDKEEIEKIQKGKQAAYVKYLASDVIGILVSTKTGQNQMKRAKTFIESRKNDGKKYYLFAFDTLNVPWLEHFPFVQAWVNTACPRISEDLHGIANIADIENRENSKR